MGFQRHYLIPAIHRPLDNSQHLNAVFPLLTQYCDEVVCGSFSGVIYCHHTDAASLRHALNSRVIGIRYVERCFRCGFEYDAICWCWDICILDLRATLCLASRPVAGFRFSGDISCPSRSFPSSPNLPSSPAPVHPFSPSLPHPRFFPGSSPTSSTHPTSSPSLRSPFNAGPKVSPTGKFIKLHMLVGAFWCIFGYEIDTLLYKVSRLKT